MKLKALYFISLVVAILPMVTGSVIFWLWFFYPELHDLEIAGLITAGISTPICMIAVILMVVFETINRKERKARIRGAYTILLLLGNIPLAIFYVWFASYLKDVDRITIVNNSAGSIEAAVVFGCGDKNSLGTLEAGESEQVWFQLQHEGSIIMAYMKNGVRDSLLIEPYSGRGMGGNRYRYYLIPNRKGEGGHRDE